MKPTRHIILLFALLLAATASLAKNANVTIAFDCLGKTPTVNLVSGDGALFYYGQNSDYKGIYYLFTDAPVVNIAKGSKLAPGYDKLAFDENDSRSVWIAGGDTIGNGALIYQKLLDSGKKVAFSWSERAHLLISAADRQKISRNYTLFVVVLPMPPENALIGVKDSLTVDRDKDLITGSVTLYRTGRVIIDSVYVEGKKAPTTFRKSKSNKDTPYYREEGFAQVEVNCPWRQDGAIALSVFCTRFNNDGTMAPWTENLVISHSDEGHKKSGLIVPWWVVVVLAIVIAALIVAVWLGFRKREQIPFIVNDRELQQLREKLAHLTKQQAQLTKENERLKKMRTSQPQSVQVIIDETSFAQKCDTLFEEIEKIRSELQGNPTFRDVDEKLRILEKTIIIERQEKSE